MGFPPESCRDRAAAGLVSGNKELHDLRGAVADLQAEDISQALRVGQLKGPVMALLVVTAGDLRCDDRLGARTRR